MNELAKVYVVSTIISVITGIVLAIIHSKDGET